MMNLINQYKKAVGRLSHLAEIPVLMLRIMLGFGFYQPAIMKWKDMEATAIWFNKIGIPAPVLGSYLAASSEIAAVVLLPLGLASRIIAIPLLIVLLVAIVTVHLGNGFYAGNNGFEVPFYYIVMLFGLLINGSGKISLDNIIKRRIKQ